LNKNTIYSIFYNQDGQKKRRKTEDLVKRYWTEQAEKVILFLVSDQQPPLFKEHLAGPKAAEKSKHISNNILSSVNKKWLQRILISDESIYTFTCCITITLILNTFRNRTLTNSSPKSILTNSKSFNKLAANDRNTIVIETSFLYTLQAVTLALLSCQHPPFLSRHSLVSISVKSKPE
jgi:hypothetical protein